MIAVVPVQLGKAPQSQLYEVIPWSSVDAEASSVQLSPVHATLSAATGGWSIGVPVAVLVAVGVDVIVLVAVGAGVLVGVAVAVGVTVGVLGGDC